MIISIYINYIRPKKNFHPGALAIFLIWAHREPKLKNTFFTLSLEPFAHFGAH